MTSTQITGGSVKFTDPSNYSTGKAGCEVTIHFTVAEGEEYAAWQMMGQMAHHEAKRLATGGLPGPLAQTQPSPATTAAQMQPAPVATVVPIIGDASTVIGHQVETGISPRPIAPTPASPSEVVIGGPPTQGAGAASSGASASIATPATTASPSEVRPPEGIIIGHSHPAPNGTGGITDADLRSAVEQKLARLDPGKDADAVSRQRGPVLVGQLLGEFVTPPAKVYALSQDQRVPFLEKLAALS